jgi:ribosomal protein S18 acetylase RimI-like enzyme
MSPIRYRTTDITEIDRIRPLWAQLNAYMHKKAKTFRSHYEQMTFARRKAYFEKLAVSGSLRLDLASDPENGGSDVGYCVSSLSPEKSGEIESIFVEEAYRSRGIGSALIKRALAWFGEHGSVQNRVSVSDGNERAWEFYRKFGFYPRMMVLEQKKD